MWNTFMRAIKAYFVKSNNWKVEFVVNAISYGYVGWDSGWQVFNGKYKIGKLMSKFIIRNVRIINFV